MRFYKYNDLFLRAVEHVYSLWIFICQLRDLHLLTAFVVSFVNLFEWPPIYILLQIKLVYVYIITRLLFVKESSTDYIASAARSHSITQ